MKHLLIVIFSILISNITIAQNDSAMATINYTTEIRQVHKEDISKLTTLQILEDSLVYFADSMQSSPTNEAKINGGYAFIKVIKNVLKTSGSFTYPFTSLKNEISILDAPDKSFRIYNWEVIRNEFERRYYAVVQMSNGDFIPLVDASDQIIRGAEDSVFVGNRWFGCLYYNIVQKDIGGQKINFLIGWNSNNLNSERKIVEPFGFNSKGQTVFGLPIFYTKTLKGQAKQNNRFVLEYQKGAKVSLNYDKETDQIVFDHCESQIGDPAKKYTYVPDGTYDGLRWDGQSWKIFENIIQISDLQNGNAPIDKPIK